MFVSFKRKDETSDAIIRMNVGHVLELISELKLYNVNDRFKASIGFDLFGLKEEDVEEWMLFNDVREDELFSMKRINETIGPLRVDMDGVIYDPVMCYDGLSIKCGNRNY